MMVEQGEWKGGGSSSSGLCQNLFPQEMAFQSTLSSDLHQQNHWQRSEETH